MRIGLAYPYLGVFVLSYLIGSVSFSYLAVYLVRRRDLRRLGTGNLGARNAGRLLGWPGFVLVLLGDAGKGFLAVRLAQGWLGTDLASVVAASGVLLGHSYSLFLGFSGGKGLASAVGILLALSPAVLLVMLLLAGLFLLLTRNLYLAPTLAALFFPAVAWLFWHSRVWAGFGILLVALILWRHRHNLADCLNRRKAGGCHRPG
ncbi:MAG: glycerol-3-phosphate acyltransferase [Bacillota bacterium]|nr:glycerol-3-phosphate acyltransferase [Bacillota bacterium]